MAAVSFNLFKKIFDGIIKKKKKIFSFLLFVLFFGTQISSIVSCNSVQQETKSLSKTFISLLEIWLTLRKRYIAIAESFRVFKCLPKITVPYLTSSINYAGGKTDQLENKRSMNGSKCFQHDRNQYLKIRGNFSRSL